jgi:hypothetical protein
MTGRRTGGTGMKNAGSGWQRGSVCIVVGAQRIRDAHDLGESFSGSWLQLHGFLGHVYGTIPVRAQNQASKEAYTAVT